MAVSRHRDHDLNPFDPDETSRHVARVLDLLGTGSGKVLDLGCGDGRVASSLVRQGHRVVGLDLDGEIESTFLRATDPSGAFHRGDLRVDREVPEGLFDAVLLLGNVLMELKLPSELRAVMRIASSRLAKNGCLVVDDFPTSGWAELAEGRWADGIDESGSMQMVWSSGNPEFAIRMGEEVDPDADRIRPNERVLRLWSRRELDDAAQFARLAPLERSDTDDSGLLVYRHQG